LPRFIYYPQCIPVKDSSQNAAVLHFNSVEEFRARPFYRDDVIATGTKPSRIIGSYRFEESVHCGLKDCEQNHQHGYVVLTPDGAETNTGWDCGMDHFGVEFFLMRKEFDRAEREYPYRHTLRQTVTDAARLRKRIQVLQTQLHGGEWLLQSLRRFEKLYPRPLLETARCHAAKGEVNVFEAPSRVARGTVRGLKIFALDIQNWPLFEIEIELNEFLKLMADEMSFDQVLHWFEWTKTLEPRLAEYKQLIDEGRKFFRRDNLALLQYLAEDQQTREQLSWIVWSDDAVVDGKVRQPAKTNSWQRMLKRIMPTQM